MVNRLVIDISVHNMVLNLDEAKRAGIVGVIHKATEGRTFEDRNYHKIRYLAEKAGLLWGAYHFANDGNVEQQVENFFRVAKPSDNTLMALDYEPNGNHTMSFGQALEFMKRAEIKLGRQLVIYSGSLLKEQLHGEDHYWGSRRLWLAQYGARPKTQMSWTKPWLWQYSDGENGPQPHGVPGIGGAVDCNSYEGTPEQLAKEWPGEKL